MVNALDHDRFFCRDHNEPDDHRIPEVEASDELVEALARIVCEEEGENPNQSYQGMPKWGRYVPEGRAFIRMFNTVLNKALTDAKQ